MKKIIVTILAFIYLGTSTGANMHIHYCMGKLAGWEIGYNSSKTCSKCGMEKSDNKDNGCCKDKYKFIKNENDQKTAETQFQQIQLIAVALLAAYLDISSNPFSSNTEDNSISCTPPPLNQGIPIYIFKCVFRI